MKISVIKNFFICSFGALLLRGLSAFTAPFIMRIITPDEYGAWGLMVSFIHIVTPLIGLGLRQVLSLEYFHANHTEKKEKINEIIVIYTTIAVPLFLLLLSQKNVINHYLLLDHASNGFIVAGLCIAFMYFFVELFYQILRYEQKAFMLTLLQVSIALINFSLTLWLVYTYKSIIGMAIAQCCTLLLTLAIGSIAYIRNNYFETLNIKKHMHTIKNYLAYGLPFIPSMLFAWFLRSGDRWILAHLNGLHNVGLYTTADMFTQMFQFLVLYPWSSSYLPYILNKYTHNKNQIHSVEKENHKIMYLSIVGLCTAIGIAFFTATPLLHFILPHNYHPAIPYIWILLLGQVFLLGSYFASSLIQFQKKRYFIAFGLCIPTGLNIILNLVLIPHFNLYGCTVATLLSYMVYFFITLGYNNHLQKQIIAQHKTVLTPANTHEPHATYDTTTPPKIIPTHSTNKKSPSHDYVDKNF